MIVHININISASTKALSEEWAVLYKKTGHSITQGGPGRRSIDNTDVWNKLHGKQPTTQPILKDLTWKRSSLTAQFQLSKQLLIVSIFFAWMPTHSLYVFQFISCHYCDIFSRLESPCINNPKVKQERSFCYNFKLKALKLTCNYHHFWKYSFTTGLCLQIKREQMWQYKLTDGIGL